MLKFRSAMRNGAFALISMSALIVGCPTTPDDTDTDEVEPLGPTLVHQLPGENLQEGADLTLAVTATDEDGVSGVTLYYRTMGLSAWELVYMEAQEGDDWQATLPASDVVAPGLEYYFKGIDDSSFQVITFLPESGPSDPYALPVQVVGESLPFEEDFEGAKNGLLKELGWRTFALGFEGYDFHLNESESVSGTTSAYHRRGPEGIAPFKDWLISPPLSFEGTDQIQVNWQQLGRYTEDASHSLWISTTSDDPQTEGAFTKIADLMPPAGEGWELSDLVDLSAWGNESVVYLAWYYEGQFADDWHIDDVQVRPLQPDLRLVDVAWSPDPVDPGGSTELTLTIENRSPMEAMDVTVSVDVDPAEGTAPETATIVSLAQDAQEDVTVTLNVDAAHLDNAYLPFSVEAADATNTWSFDSKIIVGEPTIATVDFYVFETGFVNGWLGVGDPDSPDLKFVGFSGVYDAEITHTVTIDLTEHAALLPATPSSRWWLLMDSTGWGMVERFDITTGAEIEAADVPRFFYTGFPEYVYLPEPPNPVVSSSVTTPTGLSPGDSASWLLQMANKGQSTVGETTITLSSTDPAITWLTGTNQIVAPSGWAADQTVSVSSTFQIDASKKDSVPIPVDILIEDETESFHRTTSIAVPWPVLSVSRLVIDDWAAGDGDGVLDPMEEAALEISLSNLGDRGTFSTVNCTLSQLGGTATASLTGTTANFGVMSPGETEDEDGFEVEVTSGSVGDDLQLRLTCSDGTETYEADFELTLGSPPWNTISTVRDSGADAVGGYAFDLLDGKYRCDGTTLDILIGSSTAYDPASVFVEAWALSTGADYVWYQFVLQGATGKVRGYDGKFIDLSSPAITYVSATELMFSVDIASLGLKQDSISLGFGAGFCGGGDYYCDHYPDAWGDPYISGLNTTEWFELNW